MRSARDAAARASKKGRRDLDRKFGFVPRGGECALPGGAGYLDEVIDALLREERVTARYEHFDGTTEPLTLAPLTLLAYEHQLYLVAFRENLADVRACRFARLADVERAEPFRYPTAAEYTPDSLFQEAFGIFLRHGGGVKRVVLELDPRWTTYVRTHRWHSSQRVTIVKGRPHLHLRVRQCEELVAWVRSFGREARVVSPASLQAAVNGPGLARRK